MRTAYVSGKRRVFEKLRREGQISRAELARKCSLTRPAVSAIVGELMADGMVRELGPGRSTGGKPPIMLEFIPESRCAIGINLGGDGLIEGVLCNLSCGVLHSEAISYENNFENILNGTEKTVYVHKPTSQLTVGSLQEFLDRYLKKTNAKIDYIHGIDVVKSLAEQENSIGFILPDMLKSELFPTVIKDGALPRKTFSMGHAEDKRFYVECRKIK